MKIKRKLVIVTVLTVAVAGVIIANNVLGRSPAVQVSYTEIYPDKLTNSINIKGIIESAERSKVNTKLDFMVKTVNVKVGDKVVKGQVLCELDTTDLKFDIAQKEENFNISHQNNLKQFNNDQRMYNEAASKLASNTNVDILNAESALEVSKINLKSAQGDYDNALQDYHNNTNSEIITAQNNLDNAKFDLETKRIIYANNKTLYDAGVISNEEFKRASDAYIISQNNYNTAVIGFETGVQSVNRKILQLESALKTAQINYDNAIAAKNYAFSKAKQELENYQSNLDKSKISLNSNLEVIEIQKIKKKLDDCIITAPISGTVSAVYAKEGEVITGLLFVIEDTDNLKITTQINEYDIEKIKLGMPVTIKSISTGDEVYEGIVTKINPVADKNNIGETNTSDGTKFSAEIEVISKNTQLRVGLTARLTVILEQKENVYRVPYEAITSDEDGNSIVFMAIQDGKGGYLTKKVAVTKGLETDFYTEISGEGLYDGVKIIDDASNMNDGMNIMLIE